jgi:hypothetical protein
VAWEEIAFAETRQDVLEVRRRGCERAERDRAERAVSDEERRGARHAASDLEGARGDVPVRDRIAEHVQDRAG